MKERLHELLLARGIKLAVAESCTGGLLGGALSALPGSSGYFQGGVVAYDNEMKVRLLGVTLPTLRRHGAVSPQCARAMARGVRRLTGADLGLAVTGVAGPGGGSAAKPVGTVCLALCLGPTVARTRRATTGDPGGPATRAMARTEETAARAREATAPAAPAEAREGSAHARVLTRTLHLTGDRAAIRQTTVLHALSWLEEVLTA